MILQATSNEFKEIYKQQFEEKISDAEALRLAIKSVGEKTHSKQKAEKNNKTDKINTKLVYKSAPESNLLLFQVLNFLLPKDEIRGYLSHKKLLQQQFKIQ